MDPDTELSRVIEAIDKLRRRKNRPNLPAIARYLSKSDGFPSDKTISLLQTLLTQNRVKEVVYKGNISYRNLLLWRQPNKSVTKQLETTVSSGAVVSTLEELDKDGSVSEARLQAALVSKLDGAVTLQQAREQIRSGLDNRIIFRNKEGNFTIVRSSREDDTSSDSSLFGSLRESSPPLAPAAADNSFITENSQNSFVESSDNVVDMNESLQNTDDSNSADRPNLEIARTDSKSAKQDKPSRKSEEATSDNLHLPPAAGLRDNKRRRIIRKKTIYDPSEFELTPLTKKNKKKNSGVGSGGKEKCNRIGRPRGSKSFWTLFPTSKSSGYKVSKSAEKTEPSSAAGETESAPATCTDSSNTDNNITTQDKQKGRSSRTAAAATAGKKICCVCSTTAAKSSSIYSCSLCLNIAHKDCVKTDSFYIGSRKWRCDECKDYNPVFCYTCELPSKQDKCMLMCDFCEEFYHVDCHYPSVSLPLPESTWRCASCPLFDKLGREKVKVDVDEESSKSSSSDTADISTAEPEPADKQTAAESSQSSTTLTCLQTDSTPPHLQMKVSCSEIKKEEEVNSETQTETETETAGSVSIVPVVSVMSPRWTRHRPDEPIPLVDDWTAEQVSLYFHDKFGQDVADAFLSQAIDGKSLKRLSRQEVTNDLGLQLGIALKVLYYVKKIQLGTNILQQLWA